MRPYPLMPRLICRCFNVKHVFPVCSRKRLDRIRGRRLRPFGPPGCAESAARSRRVAPAKRRPPLYAAGELLIRLPRNSAIYAFFIVYRRQYCSFILSFHASLKILVKNINWVFTFLFSHAKILSEKDLAVLRREKNGVLFS